MTPPPDNTIILLPGRPPQSVLLAQELAWRRETGQWARRTEQGILRELRACQRNETPRRATRRERHPNARRASGPRTRSSRGSPDDDEGRSPGAPTWRVAQTFLGAVLRNVPPHLGVGICEHGAWRELQVVNDSAEGAQIACAIDARETDAYVTPALFRVGSASREARASAGLVGLALDLDVQGSPQRDGTAKTTGAPDLRAAVDLAYAVKSPSFLVRTGGGLHPWWLFDRPWVFRSDEDRDEAARLLKAWHALHSGMVSWRVDATADLARLLRIPGTRNHKTPEQARPVTLGRRAPHAR